LFVKFCYLYLGSSLFVIITITFISDFKKNRKPKIYKCRTTSNDSTQVNKAIFRNWESCKAFSSYECSAL